MALAEPTCWTRKCKHFQGVGGPDDTEVGEYVYCKAFPDGIPGEIAYGNNKHEKPLPGQGNEIVYERKE